MHIYSTELCIEMTPKIIMSCGMVANYFTTLKKIISSRNYLTLNLEGMSFGTLDDLTINVKLNEFINLVDSGRDNLLFRSFARNVVNTGNRISEKVDRQADSKWLIHFERLFR